MSAEVETETVEEGGKAEVGHADMFFRYVAAICQAAGVQAFTMAVAVPKGDGTSAILSFSAAPPNVSAEWKAEVAKLLAESATKSADSLVTPATTTKASEVN